MRAEQLRNHVCDEKDCPGAKRMSAELSNFCPRCHVVSDVNSNSENSAVLPRLYLRHMQVHVHPGCTPGYHDNKTFKH